MKIQFRLLDGKVLDVKKAFIFRVNFDKEYLFYTTNSFNDEEIVPVIFGELIGPSMVKMASEDKEVVATFLNLLSKDEVDNISNYAYIKYPQLDVTILSGQKTFLPGGIINKYSYDFEVVMPESYDVINDPTPEIKPVLESNYIGKVKQDIKIEPKEERKEEVNSDNKVQEVKDIPTDVTLTPKVINKELSVSDSLATKVFEQLVNSDPVDEIVENKVLDAIPLKINMEDSIYVDKEVFEKALENVNNEPILESIEEAASKEIKDSSAKAGIGNERKNELSAKRRKGKSFYLSIIVYAILLVGIIYFGSKWLEQTHTIGVDGQESSEVSMLCETHLITEQTNRKVNSVNAKFNNGELIEIIDTETYFFEDEFAYNSFKEIFTNDDIIQSNGYRERYDYNDTSLIVVHVKQVVKNLITIDEWVRHVGLNTSYQQILTKYTNAGYVCK